MERLYANYPLDRTKEQIRLLHISAGPWDADLSGHFSVVSLADDNDFVALSYTWGNIPVAERPTIDIQGCKIPISQNLHAGLRRLRWHASHRETRTSLVIWADAVCIAQDDLAEKQHQIPLMRKIYSSCKFAAVWLGELPSSDTHPADAISVAVSVAERLIEKLYLDEHLTDIVPFDRDSGDLIFEIVNLIFDESSGNPWFTRRWVLQEVILASAVKVYFGEVLMDLKTISQAMNMYAEHVEKACCMTSNAGHYILRRNIQGFLDGFALICDLRENKDKEAHIFELCKNFANRETSLEADYVYALLGLTNPPSKIIPDYTLPIHKIMTDVCVDYIHKTQSLDFLRLAGVNHSERPMPSWVIDWTESKNFWRWPAWLYEPVASLSQKPLIKDDCVLQATVYNVDEIDTVTRFSDLKNSSPLEMIRANFLHDFCGHTSYPTGGSYAEAWIRTLNADSCWGTNSARRLLPEDYDFYFSEISGETVYSPDQRVQLGSRREVLAEAHLNNIVLMRTLVQHGSVLFSTKKGFVGMADEVVEAGDCIYLVSILIPF